jgi:hypothetical protein
VNRLAGDGKYTIADEMKDVPVQGLHRIQVKDERSEKQFFRSAIAVSEYFLLLVNRGSIQRSSSQSFMPRNRARRRDGIRSIGS